MSRNVLGLMLLLPALCDVGFAQNLPSSPDAFAPPPMKSDHPPSWNPDTIPTGPRNPIANSFPQPSNHERDIQTALDALVELEVDQVPLQKVLRDLGRQRGINIVLDSRFFTNGGMDPDSPVTINLRGVRLRSALKLILEPLKLAYYVKDEVLRVAPALFVEQQILTKVYSTAGLATTPDELTEVTKALEQTVKLHAALFEETGGQMPVIFDWYGHAVPSAQAIVITNNRAGHAVIEELLEGLRQAAKLREYPNYQPFSRSASSDRPIIPDAATIATQQRPTELLQP